MPGRLAHPAQFQRRKMARQNESPVGIPNPRIKLKKVLWLEDLKASLRIATEKLIHKTSSTAYVGWGEASPSDDLALAQSPTESHLK